MSRRYAKDVKNAHELKDVALVGLSLIRKILAINPPKEEPKNAE